MGEKVRISLLVLGTFFVLCTALPLLGVRHWWIRMLDFPRVQVAGLLLVTLVSYGVLLRANRSWWGYGFASILGLAFCYQVAKIVPYTPLVEPQAKSATGTDAPRVSILVANVLEHNREVEPLLAQVRAEKPDLVLVLEIDEWWAERLGALDDDYPHSLLYPLKNTYGIGLLSKLELVDPQIRKLIETDIPSIDTRVVLANGREVQLYGVHPEPPAPAENKRSTERDAELVRVGLAAKKSTLPVIVAGDMNDVAWSETTRRFQRVSGLLDPRIGRGLFSTFHAEIPLLRWPLDHVFFSPHFRVVAMRRLGGIGSDHFPILLSLSYEPGVQEEHEDVPETDREDRANVREVLHEARVDDEPD